MKEHETLPPLGDSRKFGMIDVGDKKPTKRKATAQGRISVGQEAFQRICDKRMSKGDVLAMAEVAGIMAAKNTSNLLPLCHPLPLESVNVWFEKEAKTNSFWAFCCASTTAKTGVEMEALAGVHGALLSIYDLTKVIEPALLISDIRLNRKEGGKNGVWIHPDHEESKNEESASSLLDGITCAILTISDRCSQEQAPDKSGPEIEKFLRAHGATISEKKIVADHEAAINETVLSWTKAVNLVISTGGTGLGPRDLTIGALRKIANKEVPGIGEMIRQGSLRYTNQAWLSSSTAFVVGKTLVIALPGSHKAVGECLSIIEPILPHAIHITCGGDH